MMRVLGAIPLLTNIVFVNGIICMAVYLFLKIATAVARLHLAQYVSCYSAAVRSNCGLII